MAAIFIVSNIYYGMPRGQLHINLPPEHPIMSFETIEIKMATISAKRFMIQDDVRGPLDGPCVKISCIRGLKMESKNVPFVFYNCTTG